MAYRDAVEIALAGRRAPDGPLVVEFVLAPPGRGVRDFEDLAKVLLDALTKR